VLASRQLASNLLINHRYKIRDDIVNTAIVVKSEIVLEQVLVLFRAGTTSLQSGLGTFFVLEPDHAKHFRQISIYIKQ